MSNLAGLRHLFGKGTLSSAFSLLAGSGLLSYANNVSLQYRSSNLMAGLRLKYQPVSQWTRRTLGYSISGNGRNTRDNGIKGSDHGQAELRTDPHGI